MDGVAQFTQRYRSIDRPCVGRPYRRKRTWLARPLLGRDPTDVRGRCSGCPCLTEKRPTHKTENRLVRRHCDGNRNDGADHRILPGGCAGSDLDRRHPVGHFPNRLGQLHPDRETCRSPHPGPASALQSHLHDSRRHRHAFVSRDGGDHRVFADLRAGCDAD